MAIARRETLDYPKKNDSNTTNEDDRLAPALQIHTINPLTYVDSGSSLWVIFSALFQIFVVSRFVIFGGILVFGWKTPTTGNTNHYKKTRDFIKGG
jgi:hypothetical protein